MSDQLLALIQSQEAVFYQAGQLALALQENIQATTKSQTGINEIDIVTQADLAVQEMILTALAQTKLRQCRLIAEEKSPTTENFNPNGEITLTIDPIDGTSRYAAGQANFSLIVSLQYRQEAIYSFIHFPALGWTHRLVENFHEELGQRPVVSIHGQQPIIIYSYGNPQTKLPAAKLQQLVDKNFTFAKNDDVTPGCGSTMALFAEAVEGYYCENPLLVDGLVGLHYAKVHQWLVEKSLEIQPKLLPGGYRYSGYYLITRPE
jgi:fructose-1,6-bisphosphatase/inositol monophosphatase family enzyme